MYQFCVFEWMIESFFFIFGRVRKTAKSGHWLRHVCLSVRMKQLGSHSTDFYEISHFRIFRKSAEKILVLLKCDKNNRYFTWRPMYIYDNISLNYFYNEKCFGQKLYRKSKHTFYVQ
jgi:hypothetical protein